MSIVYSLTCINARLNGVVSAIDDGAGPGQMVLLGISTVICTITLSNPCGTVSGGILTFTGSPSGTAANTGNVITARLQDSNGVIMVSGLTVGIPGSGADVILSNGLSSTLVSAGQAVQLLSAQITGS